MADEKTMKQTVEQDKKDEITIKFGKGLAEPFTAKDGKEYMRITIPNQDPADKTPWASFVLPAKAVHENQYGKGLWAKISAEGTTVVTKPVLLGQDEAGKNVWEDKKTQIPNKKLKAMVESYKARTPQEKETQSKESAVAALGKLTKDPESKRSVEKPRSKAKVKSQEL